MKTAVRIAIGSAAMAIGIAAAAPANAQVRFEGSFPFPHPRVSIGFAGPSFAVGAFAPYGYDVYQDPDYGFGLVYQDQWIPCQLYGSRWVIIGSPVFYGRRDFGLVRPYWSYRYGFASNRFAGRGFESGRRGFRDDRRFTTQGRDFRDNRGFGPQGRSSRDSRSNGGRSDGRRTRDSRDSRGRYR